MEKMDATKDLIYAIESARRAAEDSNKAFAVWYDHDDASWGWSSENEFRKSVRLVVSPDGQARFAGVSVSMTEVDCGRPTDADEATRI